jgi:anti-sigma-K factor RskA
MYDDDRDALGAEYVLGTLSAEEREQAEALLASDHGFAETVRLWEHRLGELNVMVEAVEPPADLWERIKSDIGGVERRSPISSDSGEPDGQLEPINATAPATPDTALDMASGQSLEPVPDLLSDGTQDSGETPVTAGLVSTRLPPEVTSQQSFEPVPDLLSDRTEGTADATTIAALASTLLPPELAAEFGNRLPRSAAAAPRTPTNAELIRLDRTVHRWRGLAVAASAVAALLAIYIGVARFAPGLAPVSRQSQSTLAAPKTGSRLVAVLQQEPTAPAFLLMLDPQERTITVRRLTAAPDAGRSYELWLNSAKLPKPASLGLLGSAEFTSRPIPSNFDVETMQTATYSVSLEPAGGSASGAPSGPMLFKGQMVEVLPRAPG